MEDIKEFERDILRKITPKRKFDWMRLFMFIVLGMLIFYVGVVFFTRKQKLKEPSEITKNLDSLKKENVKLTEAQRKMDSVNAQYEVHINIIDSKLDTLTLRTVVVKEYYHDVIDKSRSYNNKQIDSFFKKRYKY
jgi:hypothetical protein